jgi:hypothetical protein
MKGVCSSKASLDDSLGGYLWDFLVHWELAWALT